MTADDKIDALIRLIVHTEARTAKHVAAVRGYIALGDADAAYWAVRCRLYDSARALEALRWARRLCVCVDEVMA